MSTFKKTTKSKVRTEEDESFEEEFFDEPPVKKFKVDQDIEASGELRHKTLNIMNRQLQAWKQNNDTFMKDLNKIITNLEADHEALKNNVQNNVQKVEQLNGYIVKHMQQTTAACNEKVEAVRAIFSAFKNDCEEIGEVQKAEINKLGNELDEDIQNLKQKLIADTKRRAKKKYKKSFFQVLQNNLK